MPVTKEQADMLAALACAARPRGARRWDAAGVAAVIGKVKHLALADVAMAALRAADDRSLETPGAIGNTAAPCWRERNKDRPEPVVTSRGPWCQTCGRKREGHGLDHEFEPPHEKRDAESIARIAAALRDEVKPMREPAHKAGAHHPRDAAGADREAANAAGSGES